MTLVELKDALKEKKITFGTKETIKNLKRGKVSKVFLASNCPKNIKEDVNHYAKISKVEIVELKQQNDEIATICKKPFPVTVLSY